ncbi:SRR1-domain-containing protein [Daedalea quercina L-15889]|uniref:SRR1-domain-containing protein n=1 Tax=Daedalea quercina L-15889 TaxID=1314783 RepID=A0A165Q6I9_9APHY|nr:SRR1-domain-containing protein [Daedalea quercina L-15889]
MSSREVPSFGYSDAFKPARPRKKRNNRPAKDVPSPSAMLQRTMDELSNTECIRECKRIVRESLDAIHLQRPDVLCLGLGSPSASRDARAQLAFLLAICDDLQIDRAHVSVYDPVFAAEDIALLAALGHVAAAAPASASCPPPLTPPVQHGRFRAAGPTVAFMPHCDLRLYENLLRENWSGADPRAGLSQLVLIANRLSDYAER